MSEEVKEAIEEAKKQIEEAHNLNEINVFMTDSTTLKTLLNYIEKLQKENDTLKTTINKQSKDISEQLQELDKKDKEIEELKADINELYKSNEHKKKEWVHKLSLEAVKSKLSKKDKVIDKIETFCRNQLAFRNRLTRNKEEITPFNNGRFCMSEQILDMIKKAEE